MAVQGIYFGLDEPRLVVMRDEVLAALKAARTGKRFESVSGGGKAFTKAHLSIDELRSELEEITAALRRINPETYGRRTSVLTVAFNADGLGV